MAITSKVLSNTFWQIAGKLLTAVLGIISIKAVTTYLNGDAYGQYTNMFDYISLFAIAADFGLYTIGVREMAKKEQPVPFILGNILSLRIILIVITMLAGIILAQYIPKYENTLIDSGLWLVALTTSLVLLNGTLTTVLQYNFNMLGANISLILGKIISVGYILLVIFSFFPSNPEQGFSHLLYSGILGNILMLGITIYFVKKHSVIRLQFHKNYIKELLSKSAPYGLSLVLSTIYFRIDAILIVFLRSYFENGIYSVPLKLMEILSTIPIFFMNTLLPVLTSYIQTAKDLAAKTVSNAFQLLLLVAAPITIGGFILAFPITFAVSSPQYLSGFHCNNNIQIVFQNEADAKQACSQVAPSENFHINNLSSPLATNNSDYFYQYGSDIALKFVIFAIFFSFLNTLFNFGLIALDQQKKLLLVNLIGVLFNTATNLALIPYWGFRGAAFTTILSEIIILSGTYFFYRKYLTFQPNWLVSFKILASAILMGIGIHYLQPFSYRFLENWNVLILVPLGGIIYLILLFITRAISIKQIKTLLHPQAN